MRVLKLRPPDACLPVKYLTVFSCRPDSRFLPFGTRRYGSHLKQKHRSVFQVLTCTKQLVRCGQKNLGPAIAEPKFYCAHQDLNLEPTDYESVALTN